MLSTIKQTRNRSATKKRIVEAFEELLAQEGVNGLSVSLLAKKAGTSKALIYRYFDGLQGLLDYYLRLERNVHNYSFTSPKHIQPLAPANLAPIWSRQALQLFRRVRALRAAREMLKTPMIETNSIIDAVLISDNIKAYFTEDRRKLVSVKAIEEMAGVPRNTLLNLITVGRSIPKRHMKNIVNILEVIGYH